MIKKVLLSTFVLIFLSINSFGVQRYLTRHYYVMIGSTCSISFDFKITVNIDENTNVITSIVSVTKSNVIISNGGSSSNLFYYANVYQSPNTAEVAWSYGGGYLGNYVFTAYDFAGPGSGGGHWIPIQNPE